MNMEKNDKKDKKTEMFGKIVMMTAENGIRDEEDVMISVEEGFGGVSPKVLSEESRCRMALLRRMLDG